MHDPDIAELLNAAAPEIKAWCADIQATFDERQANPAAHIPHAYVEGLMLGGSHVCQVCATGLFGDIHEGIDWHRSWGHADA